MFLLKEKLQITAFRLPLFLRQLLQTEEIFKQHKINSTITVKVHYENSKFPEASFDRTYSDEAVFSSDLDINAIETSQVKLVNERIINKIFNDIVANW